MAPNDTPYVFVYDTSNPADEVPIGKEEFDRIKPSAEHVLAVQEIEDLYDMLVNAVWKFDQVFFRYADLARFVSGLYELFYQKRQEISSASIEVFSILQMFLDYQKDNPHVKHEPLPQLKTESAIRKCKALRNYLQHVGTFPMTITDRSMMCAQKVDFSSIRFTMFRREFDLQRLNPNTRKDFESQFPEDAEIDLYEVVSHGVDVISRFVVDVRALPFFNDEYAQCKEFLEKISSRTFEVGKICLRYADGIERKGRDAIIPYLANENIKRIEALRKRHLCRPVSKIYVTNAPNEFLDSCNRVFMTAEVRRQRFMEACPNMKPAASPPPEGTVEKKDVP